MGALADDWRRRGQEAYLRGARLTWKNYQVLSAEWEHEHCDFCLVKFLDPRYSAACREALLRDRDSLRSAGYTNLMGSDLKRGAHWICEECFGDFGDEFGWEVVPTDPDAWPYEGPEPARRPTSSDVVGPPRRRLERPQ